MRTSIHLPDELLARAKQKAAAEGRTLTSLIEEGLRFVVAEKAERRGQNVPLPISHATGGLLPGIDPIKLLRQDVERDDIETLLRTDHLDDPA